MVLSSAVSLLSWLTSWASFPFVWLFSWFSWVPLVLTWCLSWFSWVPLPFTWLLSWFAWAPVLCAWILSWIPLALGAALVAFGGVYLMRKTNGHWSCCVSEDRQNGNNKKMQTTKDYNPGQDKEHKDLPFMSLEDIKKCNGENNRNLYVALEGVVYDVGAHANGRGFYGPGGTYSLFAGSDATVALARMALEKGLLNTPPSQWQSLSPEERRALSHWVNRFEEKYHKKGFVDFGEEENKIAEKWRRNH